MDEMTSVPTPKVSGQRAPHSGIQPVLCLRLFCCFVPFVWIRDTKMIRAVIWFMTLYSTVFGAGFLFAPHAMLGVYSQAFEHYKTADEGALALSFIQLYGGIILGMGLTHFLVALRGDKSSEILLTRLNVMTALINAYVLYFLVLPRAAVTYTNERSIQIQVCCSLYRSSNECHLK